MTGSIRSVSASGRASNLMNWMRVTCNLSSSSHQCIKHKWKRVGIDPRKDDKGRSQSIETLEKEKQARLNNSNKKE